MRRSLLPLLLLPACADTTPERPPLPPPEVLRVGSRVALDAAGPVPVYLGGYGSGMAVSADGGTIYLLSDRGPNYELPEEEHKGFVRPGFTPRIGVFVRMGDSLALRDTILLRDEAGTPLTGLPNPSGPGATGEVPRDRHGGPLPPHADGVDPEALALAGDGTFWVGDEYGPHLLHLDRDGRTLERRNPFNGGLPRVLARRRANRGVEGLAWDSAGGLLAALQSPLDNPKAVGRASRVVRLVAVDPATRATRQYLYLLDEPEYVVSDLAALGGGQYYILETDTDFPGDSASPSRQKKVYRIDLAGATDVSDQADGEAGRLVDGLTLEALGPAELEGAGIQPVGKVMVLDLLDPTLGRRYLHNKPEGLAVLGGRILIANDDDFGIDDDGRGSYRAKRLAGGETDFNEVWVVEGRERR